MKTEFVVMAKAPVPGSVKTRLAASIGERAAAQCHMAFIADVVETVSSVCDSVRLAYAGDPGHAGFAPARDHGATFVEQPTGDLGARMLALVEGRPHDVDATFFVGTDSPTLPKDFLYQAVDALGSADVVVGPSFDGGYYLIGMRQPHRRLFEAMPWSTAAVFGETLARCRNSGLECAVLPFWYDVDVLEDLLFMRVHLREQLCHTAPKNYARTLELFRSLEAEGIIEVP